MKIKISFHYEFDIEKERKRINKCFSKKEKGVKERQLDILEAFEKGDLIKVGELINKLPYNKENECPEQEYVGLEISNFLSDICFGKMDTIEEIILDNGESVKPPKIK